MPGWLLWYVDGEEGLESADCELALGVAGEAVDAEIEPAFRVGSVSCAYSVIDAAESILYGWMGTLNSESCLTSCMLPLSKAQSMWI